MQVCFLDKNTMNIIELKAIIRNHILIEDLVSIRLGEINGNGRLRRYNDIIRKNVQDLPGIYLWENESNNEVWYIGMAGKINQQGVFSTHSVLKRLQATRGKHPVTLKDIQTNKYLLDLMIAENCNLLNIHIIHLQDGQMPGYIEAVLINAFYQRNGVLPKYNSAF